ncbi:host attachment protein [Nitrospirota bacterium]
MKEIIVTADLGHLKAYQLFRSNEFDETSARVELIKSFDQIGAHEKKADKVSDAEGRFRRSGSSASYDSAGSGERHNTAIENRKRLIKNMAYTINMLLKVERPEAWHLAAGKTINNGLLSNLEPTAKGKLGQNLKADLTNLNKADLLGRFYTD